MAVEIVMPRLGWTMEEGTLVEWLKQPGEAVQAGEVLFTVETDKAINEVESFDAGRLHIPEDAPGPGATVPVGTVLGFLLAEGEEPPASVRAPAAGSGAGAAPAASSESVRPGARSAPASEAAARSAAAGAGSEAPGGAGPAPPPGSGADAAPAPPSAGSVPKGAASPPGPGAAPPAASPPGSASPGPASGPSAPEAGPPAASQAGSAGAPDASSAPTSAGGEPAGGAKAPTSEAGSAPPEADPAISPRARRLAQQLGIDWRKVRGTGRTGRITEDDVRAAAADQAAGGGSTEP